MTDTAVGALVELGRSGRLQHELAQISARATLVELAADVNKNWRYRTERVVRNISAIQTGLYTTIADAPEALPDVLATARIVAQGWEDLARLGDHVPPSTALLHAALGYELAGYQANAACLAREVTERSAWTTEPSIDGVVAAFLQRLFLRVRSLRESLAPRPDTGLAGDELTRRAAKAVFAIALSDAATYFLTGREVNLQQARTNLALALRGFREIGDAVLYNAAAGIDHLLPVMAERSTWHQLATVSGAPRWRRYLQLLARGLGQPALDARSISELWPSQRAALSMGLLSSAESLAIRMPTSAGKTRVAELAMARTLVDAPGAKCLYIAPFRALVTEVGDSFVSLFQDLGYAVSTVPGGFDQDQFGQLIAETDKILVLTPEKLDLLFRLQPELLDSVALVVVDEGHVVSDRQRGPKFELLVSRLRHRLPAARFLLMSAVVPDETLDQFASWIGGGESIPVTTSWRPSALRHGKLEWKNRQGTLRFFDEDADANELRFVPGIVRQRTYEYRDQETRRTNRPRFPEATNKAQIAAELAYTYAPHGPVLVFAMQTNWAEAIAGALRRRVELTELSGADVHEVFRRREPSRSAIVAREWFGEDHYVTKLLERGIAFHHGRLPEAVREAIERDFRARNLAVLVATTTLAQGVNLPVRTAIMHSCRSRDADGSQRVLPARDYWNIAGRAGRAGEETVGTCIHIVRTPLDDRDFLSYVRRRNRVEPVESAIYRLLLDLVASRISSEQVARHLDADLLALLVEEERTALDAPLLRESLQSSLFSIQALDKSVPVEPIIDVMTSTANQIVAAVPDADLRRLYSSTGLSSVSCLLLSQHVKENASAVTRALGEQGQVGRDELTELLLDALSELPEMEPEADLTGDERLLMSKWLDGESVAMISMVSDKPEDVTRYIEEVFSYLLPWGISAYLRIAGSELELDRISPVAGNIAGMVKYGLPTAEAVWAKTAGVTSRDAASRVASRYRSQREDTSPGDFRNWLASLNPDLLNEEFGLTGSELESTARAVLQAQTNQYLLSLDATGDILPLETECSPGRRERARALVDEIDVGDEVMLARDRDSQLNRNAVYVMVGTEMFGYVRADAAQAIGPELDSGRRVRAHVVDFVGSDERSAIRIRVTSAS